MFWQSSAAAILIMTEITDRLTAALTDRYTIERKLGAGGMLDKGIEGVGGRQ